MFKGFIVVVVAGMLIVLAGVPVVCAESHSISSQAWNDPATGVRIQFFEVKSNDWMRGNQIATYAFMTDEVVPVKAGQKSYVANPTPIGHDATGTTGVGNAAVAGFVSNLPTGAGILGAGFAIRPSPNTNIGNANPSNVNSQKQGFKSSIKNTNYQAQSQFQQQKQKGSLSNANINTNVNDPKFTNSNVNVNTASGGAGGNSIDATNSAVSIGTGNVTTNH